MNKYFFISKLSKVVDKLLPFFNPYKLAQNQPEVLYFKESLPFKEVPTEYLDPNIQKSFNVYNSVKQTEYLYRFTGEFFIEPDFGWIILPHNKYLAASHPYLVYPKPSALKINFGINKVRKIEKVISIRYGFGNYWHFFNDIIGQLNYINQFNLDPKIPVLAPKKLLGNAYVREFFEQTALLGNREWIFQEEYELVSCQEVYLAKNLPNTKENFISITNLLNLKINAQTPDVRLFLKRGTNRGRRITNNSEIENLVKEFNYTVLDTDLLSFNEQVNIFKRASSVVGIHGAGLANLMFRSPKAMQVLEIFPADLIPPHYFWLCHELGFSYDAVLGSNQDSSGGFSVPVEELRKKLINLHS